MSHAQYTWSSFLWRCDGDGLFSKQWVMFFRHIFLTLSQLGPSPESGTFLQALWSSPWHIVHVHWFISIFSKLHHHRYLLRGGLLRSIFLSDLCSISRFSPWVKSYTFSHNSFSKSIPYLIFVIFFTLSKFLENKIYTEKRQLFALNL